jgi:predicted aldo/keto reductase-like oxidoreductase
MGLFTGLKLYFTGTGITSKSRANAGQCVSCGQCERHCPQKIKIARELKTVRKRLEPWYARLVVKIARFFMGVDKKEK